MPTLSRLLPTVLVIAATMLASDTMAAHAQQTLGDSKAEAERAVQGYLAIWSTNSEVNEASVTRFYAPRVVYYGKTFSRAGVLADKQNYIRRWPVRHYEEVPGSIAARCNPDRSLCTVSVTMRWRRVDRHDAVSTGQARMRFDFIEVEGARKIARESARIP